MLLRGFEIVGRRNNWVSVEGYFQNRQANAILGIASELLGLRPKAISLPPQPHLSALALDVGLEFVQRKLSNNFHELVY